jgi:hypothetical protein
MSTMWVSTPAFSLQQHSDLKQVAEVPGKDGHFLLFRCIINAPVLWTCCWQGQGSRFIGNVSMAKDRSELEPQIR